MIDDDDDQFRWLAGTQRAPDRCMSKTSSVPEQAPPRRPEPELKLPKKPEPEIKIPPTPAKPEVGDDQGDSGPDKENPVTQQSKTGRPGTHLGPEDAHIGATEDEVSDTDAPSGDEFKDEPRQG
jgi:hypothetical protein